MALELNTFKNLSIIKHCSLQSKHLLINWPNMPEMTVDFLITEKLSVSKYHSVKCKVINNNVPVLKFFFFTEYEDFNQ